MVFSCRVMLTLWGCPLAMFLWSTSILYGSLVPPRLYRICKFPTGAKGKRPSGFSLEVYFSVPSPTAAAPASYRLCPFHAHGRHSSLELGSTTLRPRLIVPESHMFMFANDKHQWPLSPSWSSRWYKCSQWGWCLKMKNEDKYHIVQWRRLQAHKMLHEIKNKSGVQGLSRFISKVWHLAYKGIMSLIKNKHNLQKISAWDFEWPHWDQRDKVMNCIRGSGLIKCNLGTRWMSQVSWAQWQFTLSFHPPRPHKVSTIFISYL